MSDQPKPATKAGKIILDAASQLRDMAMEPKPRTGDCTCDIDTVCAVHGGGKPKPTTGEHESWDWIHLQNEFPSLCESDAKDLSEQINAGLAAERTFQWKSGFDTGVKHMKDQLAAEREKVQQLVKALQEIANGSEASGDSLRRYAANEIARFNQNTGLDWIGRGDQ